MKYSINHKQKESSRKNPTNLVYGFTLIEMLIAISILLIAVVGPMTLMSQNIGTLENSKDRIVASFLAEEAIEFIAARKRQNSLSVIPPPNIGDIAYGGPGSPGSPGDGDGRMGGADSWDDGFQQCNSANGCYLDTTNPIQDYNSSIVKGCGARGCPQVEYCESDHFYGHSANDLGMNCTDDEWIETEFRRTVMMEKLASHEYRIEVTVDWNDSRGENHSFELRSNIYHTTF